MELNMRIIDSIFMIILFLNVGIISGGDDQQKEIKKKYDAFLKADDLDVWMRRLTAHPHHVGSPWDKSNAEFIKSQFQSWGFDTRIEEFYVLFPTPKIRQLEMTSPVIFTASLTESPLKEDVTSGQVEEQLPSYNIYSADGDVTAELVYANYGIPKDYEILAENGIDVKGKIVIVRYGGSWRGVKPKVAAEHGAAGCIIYSDPKEDGYYQGDVYPAGPFRNETSVQRGSVADVSVYSGDPLTPFVGALKDAKRLDIKDAATLTKIPVLPISYGDALPLLRSMSGPVAPDEWRGALPITYHLGPGKTTVHLKLEFNWEIKPIYDVISVMKGSEFPDEWIIRGNHHDAWVNGADDPISGQVAMMEEAKSIGGLIESGWKPKRTLVYCAWDGEEPGLLGSTEWVETHADELKEKGVVYINSDGNGRGFLSVGGSHTLQNFINNISREVIDPEKNITVYERNRAKLLLKGSPDQKKNAQEKKDFHIGALGSGSDYTPFMQHIGIASMNIGFGGEDEGGSYHSIYDSYDHYTRFGDPGFKYGIALAQFCGHAIIDLAGDDILPFRFSDFAEEVNLYLREIIALLDDMRDKTSLQNKLIDEKIFIEYSDPLKKYFPPKAEKPVPYINFAPLQNAVLRVRQSAENYSAALNSFRSEGKIFPAGKKDSLNSLLIKTERALTSAKGLPGRPWYIHQIYAPGLYTGYGVKTLPGVREAIEMRNWNEAASEIGITAQNIDAFASLIDQAVTLLKSE